jgi:hypothetical protein
MNFVESKLTISQVLSPERGRGGRNHKRKSDDNERTKTREESKQKEREKKKYMKGILNFLQSKIFFRFPVLDGPDGTKGLQKPGGGESRRRRRDEERGGRGYEEGDGKYPT